MSREILQKWSEGRTEVLPGNEKVVVLSFLQLLQNQDLFVQFAQTFRAVFSGPEWGEKYLCQECHKMWHTDGLDCCPHCDSEAIEMAYDNEYLAERLMKDYTASLPLGPSGFAAWVALLLDEEDSVVGFQWFQVATLKAITATVASSRFSKQVNVEAFLSGNLLLALETHIDSQYIYFGEAGVLRRARAGVGPMRDLARAALETVQEKTGHLYPALFWTEDQSRKKEGHPSSMIRWALANGGQIVFRDESNLQEERPIVFVVFKYTDGILDCYKRLPDEDLMALYIELTPEMMLASQDALTVKGTRRQAV